MKIGGVPESIQPDQLHQFPSEIIKSYLPFTPDSELIIDMIHGLPIADNIPRDILMRGIDQFIMAFRKCTQLPAKYATIQIVADLSQHTMQKT